jgi:hypothetical protein
MKSIWKFVSSSFSKSAGANYAFVTFAHNSVSYSSSLIIASASSSPSSSGAGYPPLAAYSFSSSGVTTLIFFGT